MLRGAVPPAAPVLSSSRGSQRPALHICLVVAPCARAVCGDTVGVALVRAAFLLLTRCGPAAPNIMDEAAGLQAGPCPYRLVCNGNISANCTSQPKLCGKCCSCPNHARRRRRAGKTKGTPSKAARQSSIVGLRVALLETLLDHIVGTDGPELLAYSIVSRRTLRRALIELFILEADVHEAALHDRWDIAWFLRFAPRGLIQNVQLHVVRVAAKLQFHPSSAASSSSAPHSAVIVDLGPPPGLECVDAVASSIGVQSDTQDDDLADIIVDMPAAPAEVSGTPVSSDTSWWMEVLAACEAPRYVLPDALVFRPRGCFPCHEHSDQIAARIYRQTGEQGPRWLGGQNAIAMRQHISAGSPHVDTLAAGSLAKACGMLRSWMLHRPSIGERLRGPPHLLDADLTKQFGPTGLVFGWDLVEAANIPPAFNQRGFHATSLYTLQSCISSGLCPGWSFLTVDGVAKQGIYNHIPERVHLCNNYMLHTAVDSSGWFFGPMFEIRYPIPDPHGRATTVRRNKRAAHQNLAYPDTHVVVTLYFHCVHWAHFSTMAKDHGHFVEGLFQSEWEIDPAASFEESVARSRPST